MVVAAIGTAGGGAIRAEMCIRDRYDAVQAEMARRNAAKSPFKNAVTGMSSYVSKYALSERLVCGECGTLYRRCTWTRNGEKRVVWRCVS